MFQRERAFIAELIRAYEQETGQVVPRRGNIHDMGPTVSHKTIICRKAYKEGKPTHVIARETFQSPAAVDRYILDFARVYFATVERGMTAEQAAFAIQRPLSLVQEYVRLIAEFALDTQTVYDRGTAALPGLSVYGPAELDERIGVLSFNIDGISPSEVGLILDQVFGIMTRIGLHCAPAAHHTLSTFPHGTVRFGLSYFNTAQEIDYALEALARLVEEGRHGR